MPTMDKDTLESIDRKLSVLVNLVAYGTVREMTVAEGAPLLKRLGFTPGEIAAVFDSSAKAVSVRLAEAKKKSKAQKRK